MIAVTSAVVYVCKYINIELSECSMYPSCCCMLIQVIVQSVVLDMVKQQCFDSSCEINNSTDEYSFDSKPVYSRESLTYSSHVHSSAREIHIFLRLRSFGGYLQNPSAFSGIPKSWHITLLDNRWIICACFRIKFSAASGVHFWC